ncbi:MAG: TolC family protein [Planctomycetota bacterium]
MGRRQRPDPPEHLHRLERGPQRRDPHRQRGGQEPGQPGDPGAAPASGHHYNAVDLLNQEWQRILAARQAAILAGRTYEAERRQFEVGIRTSTDVLDAAARLADAQSSEVRALADYEIARVDIAFGTGTLLGHGRVHWTPTDTAQ